MLRLVSENKRLPYLMKVVTIATLTEYYRSRDKKWHDKFAASLRRYDGKGCPVSEELFEKIQSTDMTEVLENSI